MNFLLLIRIYQQTESTIATSLLWVSYALPAIIIGPLAAASVDLFDRRKTLVFTNLLQSATIFVYALSHEASLFLLFGVAMLYSFFNQFYVPAELASLPSLVRKKELAHANGLFFLTQTTSLIVGFSLAGIFNQFFGFTKTLYLCSVLVFAAFVSVSMLPELKVKESLPRKFVSALTKFFEQIMGGYKFIRDKKSILFPFILLMLLQISISIVVVNVPALAKEVLQIPVVSSGYVLAIPVGVGAALAGLSIPRLLKTGVRKKYLIERFLLTLSIFLLIVIFFVNGLTGSVKMILGMFSIAASGYSFVGILIPAQTYLQETTPGGLRGRVFGNYWFLVTVATVFPVIFSGTITELFGVRFLFFLLAILAMALFIISKRWGQKMIQDSFSPS